MKRFWRLLLAVLCLLGICIFLLHSNVSAPEKVRLNHLDVSETNPTPPPTDGNNSNGSSSMPAAPQEAETFSASAEARVSLTPAQLLQLKNSNYPAYLRYKKNLSDPNSQEANETEAQARLSQKLVEYLKTHPEDSEPDEAIPAPQE